MSHMNHHFLPVLVRDPRFRAGRTTVQRGEATQAIAVFATLLEEARRMFADGVVTHKNDCLVETSLAYYEYGNALSFYYVLSSQLSYRSLTVGNASKHAITSQHAIAYARTCQQPIDCDSHNDSTRTQERQRVHTTSILAYQQPNTSTYTHTQQQQQQQHNHGEELGRSLLFG